MFACNGWACDPNWGPIWEFWTEYFAPAAPQPGAPVNEATGVGTAPTLSWAAPDGAVSGYTQYLVGVRDADTLQWLWEPAWTTALSVPVPAGAGLRYGLSYSWWIEACNGQNCSGWGPGATFSTAPPPAPPPNYITNTGTTPALSWAAPANSIGGLTQYELGIRDAFTQALMWEPYTTTLAAPVPASANLVFGRSYDWWLAACNDWACSTWGPGAVFTTAPAAGAAPQLAPADGATNTGTGPTLSWNQASTNDIQGQTHYYVNVWNTATQSYLPQLDADTSLSDAVSGLSSGVVYQWSTWACNGVQASQDCTLDPGWFGFNTAQPAPPPLPGYATSWYVHTTDQPTIQTYGCTTVQPSTVTNWLVILSRCW